MGPDLERQLRERNMESARSLSVTDLISVLEAKDGVIATQVWQEADVVNALKEAGIENPTPDMVLAIVNAKKPILADNSYGMEHIANMARYIADAQQYIPKEGE